MNPQKRYRRIERWFNIAIFVALLPFIAANVYVITSGDLISTAPILIVALFPLILVVAVMLPRLNAARCELPVQPINTPYIPKEPTVSPAEQEQLSKPPEFDTTPLGAIVGLAPILGWLLLATMGDRLPEPAGTIVSSLAIGFGIPYLAIRLWRTKLTVPDHYRDHPHYGMIEISSFVVSWVIKIAAIALFVVAPLTVLVFALIDSIGGALAAVAMAAGFLSSARLQDWLDRQKARLAA